SATASLRRRGSSAALASTATPHAAKQTAVAGFISTEPPSALSAGTFENQPTSTKRLAAMTAAVISRPRRARSAAFIISDGPDPSEDGSAWQAGPEPRTTSVMRWMSTRRTARHGLADAFEITRLD